LNALRLACFLVLAGTAPALAAPFPIQDPDRAAQAVPLSIVADPNTGFRPHVRIGAVLDDPALEQAVRSGLPLRLNLRIELWRQGFFDSFEEARLWIAVLQYEPLERRFLVHFPGQSGEASPFGSFLAARTAIERDYRFDLRPARSGRFYYSAYLEIETLSLSDIDELGRWLRGELQPAVTGQQSLAGALGQGVRRLLVRLLRLPTRRYEIRSPLFNVP